MEREHSTTGWTTFAEALRSIAAYARLVSGSQSADGTTDYRCGGSGGIWLGSSTLPIWPVISLRKNYDDRHLARGKL